ncbi:hypothetical protein [Streptomyces sp. ODS28]|uniref:hypothetical protein n=1 Tax=Streptomyces sp. ODS28 TaxID=3136688 RepID=UPI0031E912E1
MSEELPPDADESAEGVEAVDGEAQGEPEDAGGPRPLGVGVQDTGHGDVDAVLRRLRDVDHLAVPGHLEVYEDVHRGLRESLAGLDRPSPRS